MHIEVIGSSSQPQNNAPAGNEAAAASDVEPSGNDIFVNLSLNRKEVYIGEYIAATVKLYTRVNLSGINEIKYPPFNNFLKSDIADTSAYITETGKCKRNNLRNRSCSAISSLSTGNR